VCVKLHHCVLGHGNMSLFVVALLSLMVLMVLSGLWGCVCHQVHSFNVLRLVLNDAALALDSSGFHAAGVAAAIQGMGAAAWEVRGVLWALWWERVPAPGGRGVSDWHSNWCSWLLQDWWVRGSQGVCRRRHRDQCDASL